MSFSLVEGVVNNYITYMFGSPEIAGFFVMVFIILIGVLKDWNGGVFLAVLIPTTYLLSGYMLPDEFKAVVLVVSGFIIGLAVLKIFRT